MTFVDKSAPKPVEGSGPAASANTVIRSNRILLKLVSNGIMEKVAVRAQTMHLTLLLTSKIMFSYFRNGPFLGRDIPYDWDLQWEAVMSGYEKNHNPNAWAAVYINGAPVFKTLADPYMDVVEKCALVAGDNYDAVPSIAGKAFRQLGKNIDVDHDSNVAAVFTDHGDLMNCGILQRTGGSTQAFNYTVEGGERDHRVVQSIAIASAFLEGLNLSMVVKDLQNKIRMREITPSSVEGGKLRAAAARMVLLNKTISNFEEMYDVKYRPAKPDIFQKDNT